MATFKVRFEREVVETDFFDREIEAATIDDARRIAQQMASDANMSCPDDVRTHGGSSCEDWGVETIELAH